MASIFAHIEENFYKFGLIIFNTKKFNAMVSLIKTFFSKFFDFSGRTSRKDFWLTWLCLILLGIVITVITALVPVLALITWIYGLIILIPSLAMGARRLRDAGFSPWLMLLLLIGIGGLILIILWIFPKK